MRRLTHGQATTAPIARTETAAIFNLLIRNVKTSAIVDTKKIIQAIFMSRPITTRGYRIDNKLVNFHLEVWRRLGTPTFGSLGENVASPRSLPAPRRSLSFGCALVPRPRHQLVQNGTPKTSVSPSTR